MVTVGRPPLKGDSISGIIRAVDDVRAMRRTPGWDSVARTICMEALMAADPDCEAVDVNNGRLKTIRFIDYTLRTLKRQSVIE